jgi:hypothetical protein
MYITSLLHFFLRDAFNEVQRGLQLCCRAAVNPRPVAAQLIRVSLHSAPRVMQYDRIGCLHLQLEGHTLPRASPLERICTCSMVTRFWRCGHTVTPSKKKKSELQVQN